MRTYRWLALAVWLLLGWGMWTRGGFTFSFLFYTYSLIAAYGWIIRWVGLYGVRASRVLKRSEDGTEPADGTFTAGEEAVVEVTLERPWALPIPWLVVRERMGEAEYDRLHGPWLAAKLTYEYVLPLPERGVFAFEPIELWAGDPFGIVNQRVRVRTGLREAAVSPVPRRFGVEAERLMLSLGEGARGRVRSGEDETLDYRTYRHGDPLTRVMWKMAARTDEWFVRRYEAMSAAEETAILIDSRGMLSDEAADGCADAAAGAIVALGSRRRSFVYVEAEPSGDAAYAASWRRSLAALQPRRSAEDTGYGAALPPRSSAVIVVSAALRPELADVCRQWQAGGREVLVLHVRTGTGNAEKAPSAGSEEEWQAWLRRGGVRLIELYPKGERVLAAEGGGLHGANSVLYPS